MENYLEVQSTFAVIGGLVSIITFIIFCVMAKALQNISKNTKENSKNSRSELRISLAQAENKGLRTFICPKCGGAYIGEHEQCPECGVNFLTGKVKAGNYCTSNEGCQNKLPSGRGLDGFICNNLGFCESQFTKT